MTPTAIMIWKRPGPSTATIPIASSRPGIASMMSIMRMITLSIDAAEVAGDRAEHEADREARPSTDDDADQERVARAVEDPRELVAAERRRPRTSASDDGPGQQPFMIRSRFWSQRPVGRDPRREDRRDRRSSRRRRTRRSRRGRGGAAARPRCQRPPVGDGRADELSASSSAIAHETRILGLRKPYERSTIRLTNTKTIARKRIAALDHRVVAVEDRLRRARSPCPGSRRPSR